MKNFKIELRWGILFSLITMIWMFIEKNFLLWHDKYISNQYGAHFIALLIIFILVYYFALREKRRDYYRGKMSWKKGVFSGGLLTVIITVLSPFTVFFIYHYISPDYFHNMIEYQTTESNNMTTKSAEMFFSMKSFMIQKIFTDLSFGIIIAVIIALFFRKRTQKESQ